MLVALSPWRASAASSRRLPSAFRKASARLHSHWWTPAVRHAADSRRSHDRYLRDGCSLAQGGAQASYRECARSNGQGLWLGRSLADMVDDLPHYR
jgi:hypothetical protein